MTVLPPSRAVGRAGRGAVGGRAPRRRRVAAGGGAALALLVSVLVIGVASMHSGGGSHHAAPSVAMASMTTSTVSGPPTDGHAGEAGETRAPMQQHATSDASSFAIDDALGAHGATALCLAVMPLLLLVLRRGRAAAAGVGTVTRRPSRVSGRSQVIRTSPSASLSRLCVLRV